MKRGDKIVLKSYFDISKQQTRRLFDAGILPGMAGIITYIRRRSGPHTLVRFVNGRCLWVSLNSIIPMNETPHQPGGGHSFSDLKKIIEKIT
jgi:hypothetical protein